LLTGVITFQLYEIRDASNFDLISEMFKCLYISFVCASLIRFYIYISTCKVEYITITNHFQNFILPKKEIKKHSLWCFVYSHARDYVQSTCIIILLLMKSSFFALATPPLSLKISLSFLFLAILYNKQSDTQLASPSGHVKSFKIIILVTKLNGHYAKAVGNIIISSLRLHNAIFKSIRALSTKPV